MPGKTIDQLPLATSLSDNDQVIVRDPDDISGVRTRQAPLSTLAAYVGRFIVGPPVVPAPLTKSDDTNVTLTLGGTPLSALLQPVSIAVGWNGTLSVARGGTGSGTASGARTNLGLGNVDNTSDATKNAAAAALTNKDLTSGTNSFPQFNQNTTGSAAKWTTPRNLAGNAVDGSAAVAFANKFIVQGTSDAGLSGAQFLGALSNGLLKVAAVTGILSNAVAGTDFQAPLTLTTNNTSGAATLVGNTLNIPQYSAGTGSGDTSTNTSTSVVNELALFADTSGKLLKRSTGSGLAKLTSGVLGTATSGTDFAPGTSALTTGILKSTTTTGALTIAVAADFPTLNQNTTGSAASFTGSLSGDVTGTQGATAIASGAVTLGKLANLAANSLIGNNTGSAATPVALSPSAVLDIIGATQGTLLYRGVSSWSALAPGTAGQVLQSGGASANPSWTAVSASAGGSNKQVQFNNSGALGADANFTYSASGSVSIGSTGGVSGQLNLYAATSGFVSLALSGATVSSTSLILPAPGGSDTLVSRTSTDTLTNKTLTSPTTNNGTFNSPTLVTPTLGVATATSINKLAITAPATGSTLAVADGKTFTASNSLTLAGTDATTITFGPTGTYYPITRLSNDQTGTTYTFVLSDQGKYCTFTNASAVTVTVPPNSSVAFPLKTQIDCSALGAGKVTFAQGSGVTINSVSGNKAIGAQYAGVTLIKEATDTWTLMGNLQA